jgi:hypothetical protein
MPPSREPWIKLKLGTRRSDKLALLPNADARLAYVWILLEAKVQRRMGVFAGRAHLVAMVAEAAPYVDDMLRLGLLHVAPDLCPSCAKEHEPDELAAGDVVVHDYLVEQRDPTNADRQAAFRARQREKVTPQTVTVPLDPEIERAAEAPTVTPHTVTNAEPPPPARRRPDREAVSVTPTVTPDSRARGTTVTVTVTDEKKNVLEEEVVEATVGTERATSSPAPFLSDPNRAGRPGASTDRVSRPITPPAGLAALTPSWRHPCTNYVAHQTQHRIVDGQAVCPPCEDQLEAALAKPNGVDAGEASSIWGPVQ